jgi:hypothetical protein
MNYQDFFQRLENKDKLPLPADIKKRVGASLAVQIHTRGARPSYRVGNEWIEPETYESRFDDLFKTRLLNRHPNENEELYNWRLSNYNPLPEDIYNRFITGAKGCILQPNNYVISVDETTDLIEHNEYLNEGLEFILENPKGYWAVIVEAKNEVSKDSNLDVDLVFIEPSKVKMSDENSVAFEYENVTYFIDKVGQYTQTKEGLIIEVLHNFNEIPFWNVDNRFIQSYVKFADELAKNFSDDGMITKQYSYPKLQIVAPQCSVCNGTKTIKEQDEKTKMWIPKKCTTCDGRGVMSLNPGEHHTLSEEVLLKYGGTMPDMAKFITPDIGIPEYHLKRVMEFYNKCEDSLYLRKRINATESGDAKKEDRKDQYMFLASISKFLFENYKKALQYISAYNNYNALQSIYEAQNVVVIAPKQFDLMTDNELVNELLVIQTKTDDSMILAESQFAVTNKIYRDDNVQSKINDILYQVDELYGVTGMPLKNKLMTGVYTELDKTIHEKGYKILLRMSIEMTPEKFIEAEANSLIKVFGERVNAIMPQGIYSDLDTETNSLKGSVGGLTGMIEIAKAVASGLYDLDAAVALVSDRFGISEEDARKQLGTPSVVNSETELNKIDTLT